MKLINRVLKCMALLTSVHPTSSSTHQQSDMASKALIVLGLAALLLFSLETATARDLAKKTGTGGAAAMVGFLEVAATVALSLV
ncbi:hypothetical protein BHM03_00048417 [Ensete ventricosum]|nr:hypothetical protein BHM03_00048417 [Ensete ventricosum]